MNTAKKILKNSSVIIISHVFDTIINLIMISSLARYFGQSGFGKLSFLGVFFFFIGSTDNLLIRPILAREMIRDKTNASRIIGNGIIIRTLFSIAAIIFLWVTIWIIKCPLDIIQLAFFTSIGLVMTSLACSYETIFQINFCMGYFKGIGILGTIITLLVLYIVIFFKGDLLRFNILALIPGTISLWLIKSYAEKIIRPKFEVDFSLWRKIFKESWPLVLTSIFIFIYHRIDQVILLRMKGVEAVGSYSVAVKLAEIFNIIPVALKVSILPLMAEYFNTSKTNLEKTYNLSFKYLLLFIIPLAVWVTNFSEPVTSFFYGAKFLSSSKVLSILIWAEIFVFMGVINNAILIATNKQILDPLFTGVSAAVNIVLNFLLIPKYSFIGAAIATFFSYPIGPIMGYFIKTTRPYSGAMLYYSFKPLCASLFMFLFIYYTRNFFWISFLISPFIYLLILFLIKGVDKNDAYRLN